ncbi:heterocyst differentiation protein HetZ [Limnothrix sp. FACHB-881]|uniref:heterocyst differentiation protein HetZ n=1 Tax=Limnothrix sp. FACHB-881 TaxID=2692819 RepID=UPI00168788C4|nr:heterocyst differentiation protein HetZ [Limnothrix sp. FACHB-881]MBD2634654.1 heterocyst differentiation protein HetZ [Limnothrix sp. FACHB-881]
MLASDESCRGVESTIDLLQRELRSGTTAPEAVCTAVADRIAAEVDRICTESRRIQSSGDVLGWAHSLARHRLQQNLRYYQLGSQRGRAELHSTLSAIIYRYISPARSRTSYQARLLAIEDFLQGFYVEALGAFRRENQLPPDYTPRVRLELAEYMAFVERYAKRRIPLPGGRSQQLIVLRAQTFARQQPPETSIDMDQAAESASDSGEGYSWDDASVQQVRDRISAKESTDVMDGALRQAVVDELIAYLRDRNQEECVNYLVLRLKDLSASEIEKVLGLDARQRDYLQQRFKYHLIRFALLHRWELVHQWLDVDLERDLGLTPRQWESLLNQLGPEITKLVELKRAGSDDRTVAQSMGISASQVQKLWFKLLETAWEIRNRTESGTRRGTDE